MLKPNLYKRDFSKSIDENTPENYQKLLEKIFEEALCSKKESIDYYIFLAEYLVRLNFAGPALFSAIIPSIEHLKAPPGPRPSLTISLWDSLSTRSKTPPIPWEIEDLENSAQRWVFHNEDFDVLFNSFEGFVTFLNKEQNKAFFWISDATKISYHERGGSLRSILYWWMRSKGMHFIHGGGVGLENGGVLIGGEGGSGKSTTALACLTSELNYISDDNCLFRLDPEPYAFCIYNTAKIKKNNIKRLPYLSNYISNSENLGSEKALFFLYKHFPKKIIKGFPIKAILFPNVTGLHNTKLINISPMEGLKKLTPSTMIQVPGKNHATFLAMAELVKRIPCYRLDVGTYLPEIPSKIIDLISELKR